MSTCATARCRSWRGLTCTRGTSLPTSKTVIAVWSSLGCSKKSMSITNRRPSFAWCWTTTRLIFPRKRWPTSLHDQGAERVHTPKHGSWLNLIECAFSKMARTFLRHIRVKSKDELKTRILKGIAEINDSPVVFRWNKFDLGVV